MAKKPGRERVYEAASRWVEVALKKDDSLFRPGTAIWSLSNLDDFYNRFVLQPDESSDSFEVKFERQLSDAPSETLQLAAEILYVHLLLPIRQATGGSKKRELVNLILSWSESPAPIPEYLAEVLDDGLVHPGIVFNTARYAQLSFIDQFVRKWKQLSNQGQGHDLSDAVVVTGELATAGGVVVCEGLAYGLALACRRSEPVVVTFGSAGWSSEATAFALGRFASVMLAPSGSRTGREAAGALGRRVQAYGGNRRLPHVTRASDVAMVAGPLPEADPRRFKEMTQIYANIRLLRWEATRRAYTEVTARPAGR